MTKPLAALPAQSRYSAQLKGYHHSARLFKLMEPTSGFGGIPLETASVKVLALM
jgi:hypothetical protein